jgi:hypothetical protein
MLLHKVLLVLCGIMSAVAAAFGVMLLVLWSFDSTALGGSLREVLGAAGAIAVAFVCHLAGRWLRAREAIEPAGRSRLPA